MQLPEDKIILFDLGGVILPIDYHATVNAFKQLLPVDSNINYSQMAQSELFDRYETGQIATMHFINLLKEQFPEQTSVYDLVQAWNAMLNHIPQANLNFLLNLRKTHKIALLSNTNDLHADWFNRSIKSQYGTQLSDYFDFTFLSHEIKRRKPHTTTFDWVAKQMQVAPEQIFFMDDSVQHLEGAQKAGISTFHYPQNQLLDTVFK